MKRIVLLGILSVCLLFSSTHLLWADDPPTFAGVRGLPFELDGNIEATIATPNPLVDWSNLFHVDQGIVSPAANLPDNFDSAVFLKDFVSAQSTADDSAFGPGIKNDQDFHLFSCGSTGALLGKTDIVNAYAASFLDPISGDSIFYYGGERASSNGDAFFGVWILQDPTVVCSGSGFTGSHVDGDLFFLEHFGNGAASLSIFRWANGVLDQTPILESNTQCQNASAGDVLCATTNLSLTPLPPPPWPGHDQNGDNATDPLLSQIFFEGGVNLSAALYAEGITNACFPKLMFVSQGSASITSSLIDFALGDFMQCCGSDDDCDDGNACNGSETCGANGACQAGTDLICSAQDQCHGAGSCDPGTGLCSNPPLSGNSCNDSNACTQSDTCQAGVCTGSNPVTCSAQDQCHNVGTCDSVSGLCTNPPKTNGSACSDGNACTQTDSCQSGACTGSNPVTCSAQDQCHDAGTCDSGTGQCSNPTKPDGSSCSEGNACTTGDACSAGVCVGGGSQSCDDGNVCNGIESCSSGAGCQSGTPLNCSDGFSCTTDSCNTLSGCLHMANHNFCSYLNAPGKGKSGTAKCQPSKAGHDANGCVSK